VLCLLLGVALSYDITCMYPESMFGGGDVHLYLRGNVAPLNWDEGVLMTKTDTDTWTYTLEGDVSVEQRVKVLISD
ncbi:hypothetical protein KIPB_016788, partial [Kipferlia bialata]